MDDYRSWFVSYENQHYAYTLRTSQFGFCSILIDVMYEHLGLFPNQVPIKSSHWYQYSFNLWRKTAVH